jgi:hypothetical protein
MASRPARHRRDTSKSSGAGPHGHAVEHDRDEAQVRGAAERRAERRRALLSGVEFAEGCSTSSTSSIKRRFPDFW